MMNLKGLSNPELQGKRDAAQKDMNQNANKITNAHKTIKNGKDRSAIRAAQKILPSLQLRKNRAKQKYTAYANEYVNRSEQATRKSERKNSYQVAQKSNVNDGYTNIYRADHATNTVIKLVETDPNESTSFDVQSEAIDDSSSQVTNVGTQPMTLSGTYYIIGYSDKERQRQYNQLRRWHGVELVVDGFTHWEHALITSISKSTTVQTAANSLTVSLNFQYINKAKIQFAKQAKQAKRKPKAKTKSGSHSSTAKYVRIKPGMTYAQISSQSGTSIKELEKMNKYSSNSLPTGSKVRIS